MSVLVSVSAGKVTMTSQSWVGMVLWRTWLEATRRLVGINFLPNNRRAAGTDTVKKNNGVTIPVTKRDWFNSLTNNGRAVQKETVTSTKVCNGVATCVMVLSNRTSTLVTA